MSADVSHNDNFGAQAARVEPDAHGQAALLLVESILHILVETTTLTSSEALAAVQTAAEVKFEVASATGETIGRMKQSLALLEAIGSSFEAYTR